jgi:DNA-binding transcriptional ArsR family regulator
MIPSRSTQPAAASAKVAARMAELQANALRAAGLLKAMSNPARLVILCQLAEGERSVGELERAVGLSQSGISQHLAVLRRGEVVCSRRVGQTVLYSLASRDVTILMATLHDVFCRRGATKTANRAKVRTA